MIIGINGIMQSGKDTFAITGQENFPEQYFQNKKFAGKLKDIASILSGTSTDKFEDNDFKNTQMPKEWGMTYREFLQKLGTDALRNNVNQNIWVHALMTDYKPLHKGIPAEKMDELYHHTSCKGCGHQYTGYKRQYFCRDCIKDDLIQIYPNWIITDVRFPNEAEAIRNAGGKVIRVNRITSGSLRSDKNPHISECALDDYNFDYVIDNCGTLEEYKEKCKIIINEIITNS